MCAKCVEPIISKIGACQVGGGGVKYILALRGGKRKRACSEGKAAGSVPAGGNLENRILDKRRSQ